MARRTEKPAAWTGKIVGLLHVNRITQAELAEKLGVTSEYVCMVLSGSKSPENMEQRMCDAIDGIIAARTEAI